MDHELYFKELKSAYEDVFSTESGRKILKDLKQSASFYDTIFNENSNVLAYNEGKRTIVQHIVIMSSKDEEDVKNANRKLAIK